MAMSGERWIFRHSAAVRVTHWINAFCLTILLMSGLQIFNAHPALYLGKQSDFDHPVFSISAERQQDRLVGVTKAFGLGVTTTGVLGLSTAGDNGEEAVRAFPSWATVPSGQDLATGRRWHFAFAWLFLLNGTLYLVYSVVSGHMRRDLLPSSAGFRSLGRTLRDHVLMRFPKGDAARHYNPLQQLTYLVVIFVLLPLMVLTGLTMSPGIDAFFHPLAALHGGRQSARTVHFVAAAAILLFAAVHVAMVLVSGAFNNMRSMITGNYYLGGALE